MKLCLLVFTTMFFSLSALAVTIELPEEELAKESVLPVFEGGTVAVKSRRVVTKQKFEIGPMLGMIFNEPFFSPWAGGIHAGYHINEFHSIAINAFKRDAKLSDDARQIDSDLATIGPTLTINFPVVPVPEYLATIDYQMTAYYGKISLGKESVMNLALYIYGGAGMTDLGGKMTWVADLGVGQNLFFTPRMGLRLDMKFLMYNGLDVTSRQTTTNAATSDVDPGIFDTQFNISPSVMLGFVVLL
ncbi:outer membrane beta-barrel domain-containing protein [bacterium]|nr:outer membrane beta-barrel domain-containing protein [bacterium]